VTGSSAQFLDAEQGIPLGLGSGSFSEVEVKLPLGSRLVFYSDGITEAENPAGEEYGLERLQKHLSRADASAESLLDHVRSFADGSGLRDDASVILVKG
jgi:sigma-B regulation protein RsbU (phosphoserine phosphatase)